MTEGTAGRWRSPPLGRDFPDRHLRARLARGGPLLYSLLMERRRVVIVGGGPAGTATALFLGRLAPEIAAGTILLERARHPRDKVCAGGLLPQVISCLAELEIPLSVPHVRTRKASVSVPGHRVTRSETHLCTVIRRREFDRMLMDEVVRCGIEVRQGEAVRAVRRQARGLEIVTDSDSYLAPVVVGADGSGSLVRRSLDMEGKRERLPMGRAVLCDLPLESVRWNGHREERYDFDFRGVARGLKGYAWAFPSLIDGHPHVNLGVYSRRPLGGQKEIGLLAEKCSEIGFAGPTLRHRASPIRWYSPREAIAAANVLLVGDAAGVDPLMGEGISYCFEYGRWAAGEIATAFAASDFSFGGSQARFRASWVGKKLARLGLAADFFYGRSAPLWFAVAARWRGAQEVGLKWYNGVDEWDRRSGWSALWAAIRGGQGGGCDSVTEVIRESR